MARVKKLQERLDVLKLELSQVEDLAPEQVKILEGKANLWEEKLKEYYDKYPQLLVEEDVEEKPQVTESMVPGIKHTMMLGKPIVPEETDLDLEKELPLPPPPKITE